MATNAETASRIDSRLSQLEADLADMPDLANEWSEMEGSPRAVFEMEWSISMFDWLPSLDRHYRAGRMSDNQSARYRALLARLRELAPVINQLGFSQPTVSLDLGEAA